MKLKLREVLTINQALKAIIDDDKSNVDALFKFKLLSIMKIFENHVANFEIIRNEKIKEYGTENEDGNVQIKMDDTESIEKFNESLKPVLDSDIGISIDKLKAKDVFNKGVKAEYLIGLYPIIEE